ncbi:hypothetical protein OH492_21255 [Vibrio chagasii]|nr:hypothetical protein [Vibrio chagasii]
MLVRSRFLSTPAPNFLIQKGFIALVPSLRHLPHDPCRAGCPRLLLAPEFLFNCFSVILVGNIVVDSSHVLPPYPY